VTAPALATALQQAHALLQRKDFAAADRELRALLLSYPGHPAALHLHALVRRDAGDLAGARHSLEQAVAGGGTAEMHNSLANILRDLGELDLAGAQLDRAVKLDPSYVPAWINRGRLALRRGRNAEAVASLEQACRIQPSSVLAHVGLGDALRADGQHDRSIAVLRKALQLKPAQASTRVHLGVALRAAERPAEAIAEYDSAERSGHAPPQLLDNRAAAWLDLGRPDRARQDYDALVSRHPGYEEGHRARARLIWEYGLEGDPFESYRRLADAYPGEARIWQSWLDTLLSFRQYEQAAETATRAARAIGSTCGISFSAAVAASELGHLDQATQAFEDAERELGNIPHFLNSYARHLLRSGRPAEAADKAERALTVDRDDQISLAYLGTAWRVMGDAREFWLHDYDKHVAEVEARPPGYPGTAEEFATEAAETLRGLHKARVHPADQSLRNGTQTSGSLLAVRDPVILQIREAVVAAVREVIADWPDDPDHPLLRRKSDRVDFSGSWSVRLMQSGFHISHVHSRGWISSAYYFALPPLDATDREHAGHLQLGAPPDELGLGLPPRRIVQPKVGRLALFPSSMWHGTVPFDTAGERLTAAFDIIPAANT